MMYANHAIGGITNQSLPCQRVCRTSCSTPVEEGSGVARPAKVSNDHDWDPYCTWVELRKARHTVGARDCLIEYVRCMMLELDDSFESLCFAVLVAISRAVAYLLDVE